MIVVNDKGRAFFVRVVRKGDRYGLDNRLTHDEPDPMIEFYDGPSGEAQFVSRYYAKTLASHVGGLCLDGGVPEWSIDAFAMVSVLNLAKGLSGDLPDEKAQFATHRVFLRSPVGGWYAVGGLLTERAAEKQVDFLCGKGFEAVSHRASNVEG